MHVGKISGLLKKFKQDNIELLKLYCSLATLSLLICGHSLAQPLSLLLDHLARMMELLGKMPRKIAVGGLRSKDYFDRHGDLKRIRRLKYGSLDRFLVDRFKFSETDAREFADFLCPIINFAPEKRPTAEQCLQHPRLNLTNLTRNEVKSESSVGKVNVAMNNLRIKVGK